MFPKRKKERCVGLFRCWREPLKRQGHAVYRARERRPAGQDKWRQGGGLQSSRGSSPWKQQALSQARTHMEKATGLRRLRRRPSFLLCECRFLLLGHVRGVNFPFFPLSDCTTSYPDLSDFNSLEWLSFILYIIIVFWTSGYQERF